MPLVNKQPNNKLSILISCSQDKSFLLLFDEERSDYWIPFTDMDDSLGWKDNFEAFRKELIDYEVIDEKLLKIYKIWTLKKEFLHLIFQINVSKEVKLNCKTNTRIGAAGWYSCSELAALRPLLRSLEILEITHIYKPVSAIKRQVITGEPMPLGSLTEIKESDVIISSKNCANLCYLNLLDSAGLTPSAQLEIYQEYFTHTYPCIYMNCVSFICAMQQYNLCENILKLFFAADVLKRDFLTFQDFLFLFAVMNPLTAHYGHLAKIRCQYIFRYYNENQDGKLSFYEFKNLITDVELKKNPEISDKQLEKLIQCITKSVNFRNNTQMTFDQFYNHVLESKIRDTSLLLRFKEDNCKTLKSEVSSPLEQVRPSEFLLSFKSCKYCYPDQLPSYSIVLKTTILKSEDSPFALRDMRLLEDTMTKSVLESFQSPDNTDFIKQELFDVEEKISGLLSSLKYFSTEIRRSRMCLGECENEDKPAYSWGSANVDTLAITFILICEKVKEILRTEPRLLEIQPPVFVMGALAAASMLNIMKSYLNMKTLWRNGIAFSPAKMLFLGDYVDRGLHGVEVLMYLFANKIQNPQKLYLVRGNHEIRDIQKLFTFQRECNNTFGETLGTAVWETVNDVFDVMPLAAIIDNRVFCCHGGIPPPWLCPVVSVINSVPMPLVNCERQSPLAWTLMWNDPLRSRYSRNSILQMELLNNEGFVVNHQRGTGYCFSCSALDKFLLTNNLSHVIRAHEVVKAGFQIHQKGKLLTVFSSSNYCGGKNYAGSVLVADNSLRVCMIDTGKKVRNTIS